MLKKQFSTEHTKHSKSVLYSINLETRYTSAQHYSLLRHLQGHSLLVQELGGLRSHSAGSSEARTLSIAGIKP